MFRYTHGRPDAVTHLRHECEVPQNTGISLARKGKREASGTMKSCQIKPLSFHVIGTVRPWISKVSSDMDVPIWPNRNPGIRFLSKSSFQSPHNQT